MRYTLVYPDSYNRRAKKFFKKHPDLVSRYRKTLELLELNPHHPSLRLHGLEGHLSGLSSVSISIQYRIVIQFLVRESEILLINIGTHDEVY